MNKDDNMIEDNQRRASPELEAAANKAVHYPPSDRAIAEFAVHPGLIGVLAREVQRLRRELAALRADGALTDIAAERRRQVEAEGWTPEHDDQHKDYELSQAAAWYAANAAGWNRRGYGALPYWPWDKEWCKPCKPKDRRRDLVRAAALLVAEIERLDRAAPPPVEESKP
jgi:hypothetical protein